MLHPDGHCDTTLRPPVVNSRNTLWRRRWDLDNRAHDGQDGDAVPTWTGDQVAAAQLDH